MWSLPHVSLLLEHSLLHVDAVAVLGNSCFSVMFTVLFSAIRQISSCSTTLILSNSLTCLLCQKSASCWCLASFLAPQCLLSFYKLTDRIISSGANFLLSRSPGSRVSADSPCLSWFVYVSACCSVLSFAFHPSRPCLGINTCFFSYSIDRPWTLSTCLGNADLTFFSRSTDQYQYIPQLLKVFCFLPYGHLLFHSCSTF